MLFRVFRARCTPVPFSAFFRHHLSSGTLEGYNMSDALSTRHPAFLSFASPISWPCIAACIDFYGRCIPMVLATESCQSKHRPSSSSGEELDYSKHVSTIRRGICHEMYTCTLHSSRCAKSCTTWVSRYQYLCILRDILVSVDDMGSTIRTIHRQL